MTDVGAPLAELFTIQKGRRPSTVLGAPAAGARRLLQINDLRGDGPPLFSTDEQAVCAGPGDVLIAWDGANAGTVGCGLEGNVGSTLAVLRPATDRTYTPYVGRFLQAQFGRLNASAHGAAVPHVSRRVLETLEVPLPPLAEQRRIAAVLEKADAIRWKRRESLRLMEELLRTGYLTLVGPGNKDYHNWPHSLVADLAESPDSMRTGPFGSALRHSEFVDHCIAVLGIDNAVHNRFAWAERRFITEEKYQKFQRYTVRPGDVIITIMGTTGRAAVVPKDIPLAISTKHLAVITVDRTRVDPEFLAQAFHSDPKVLGQIAAANRGAIMSGLNLGIIKRLRVRLPPLAAQQRFADLVRSVRESRDRISHASREVNELFNSLAQRAFRGEL